MYSYLSVCAQAGPTPHNRATEYVYRASDTNHSCDIGKFKYSRLQLLILIVLCMHVSLV